MVVTSAGSVNVFSASHALNADAPISVTFAHSTLVSFLHESNADSPIFVALEKETVVRSEQPLNAFFPIVVTVSSLTVVSFVHPLKASSTIDVTPPRSDMDLRSVTPLNAVPISFTVVSRLRSKSSTLLIVAVADVITCLPSSRTLSRYHVENAFTLPVPLTLRVFSEISYSQLAEPEFLVPHTPV